MSVVADARREGLEAAAEQAVEGTDLGSSPARSSWPAWLPGLAVFVVAAGRHLGGRELWVDEAFSLAATRDLPDTLARTGGTMGLYYSLLTPWSQVSTDPAWLRLLSLLLMGAALVVFVLAVQRFAGRGAATIAGLVAACSYLPVRYAVEARAYALVALGVAISWYALDRIVSEEGARRWRRIHLAVAIALPLAHGLAVLQVGAQLVAVVVARTDRSVRRHVLVASAAAGAVVVALMASGLSDVGDWLDPLSRRNLAIFGQEVLHPLAIVGLLVAALAVGGAVVALRSSWSSERAVERFRGVALVCWGPLAVAMLLAVSVVRPSQLGRYGLSAAFGIAGLVGVALDRVRRDHLRPPLGTAAVVAVLVLLVTSHLAIGGDPQPWTESSDEVAAAVQPGDAVVFRDPEVRLPWEAAWLASHDPDALRTLGGVAELGTFERFVDPADADDVVAQLEPGDRVWYVDQDLPHATTRDAGLLQDPTFRSRVDTVQSWRFDDVELTLLVAT